MTPNDVLTRILEAHLSERIIRSDEAEVLADCLEDHGREEDARLLRTRDRVVVVLTDMEDQWYLNELVMLPVHLRRCQIRVLVEGMPVKLSRSRSME